jgi:hypothetical protein
VADYRSLRTRSGLSDRSLEGAAIGLAHTWYGVVVRHDGRPVGMGRIVGDGVAVTPTPGSSLRE